MSCIVGTRPYRGHDLDFTLYGIDIEDTKIKLDVAMRRSDYIADLVTICAIKPYDIEAANFLKIGRHL